MPLYTCLFILLMFKNVGYVMDSMSAVYLKDMLMYRVDKRQCILTNDELESIIRSICTE